MRKGDFSLICVDGAIEHVPAGFRKAASRGRTHRHRLVERGVTRLATGRKAAKALALVPLAEMGIPRMGAFDKPESWSF